MNTQKETKYRAARILSLSPTERSNQGLPLTLTDIGKLIGVDRATVGRWNEELPKILDEMRADENRRHIQERLEKDKALRSIAQQTIYPSSEVDEVLNALKKLCIEKGNAFAGKTWLQAKGELVERKQEEITIINGNRLAREIIRARRELEGMAQVPDEPSVFSTNLRLPSGQSPESDG